MKVGDDFFVHYVFKFYKDMKKSVYTSFYLYLKDPNTLYVTYAQKHPNDQENRNVARQVCRDKMKQFKETGKNGCIIPFEDFIKCITSDLTYHEVPFTYNVCDAVENKDFLKLDYTFLKDEFISKRFDTYNYEELTDYINKHQVEK